MGTLELKFIKENERNPRTITEAKFKLLKRSVIEFPEMLEKRPVAINMDNVVLGGNMRFRALKSIAEGGYSEIKRILEEESSSYKRRDEAGKANVLLFWKEWIKKPIACITQCNFTKDQEEQFIITDNSSFGSWDFDMLANEFDQIELENWGLDVWQIDDEASEESKEGGELEAKEDGYNPDETAPQRVNKGDIWKLGNNLLMCGDCTNAADVLQLMKGKRADMVFTDPPYGVSADGGRTASVHKHNMKAIENDNLRDNALESFLQRALSVIPIHDKTSFYICYTHSTQREFIKAIEKAQLTQRNVIVWVKESFGLSGFKGYRPQHEFIYYATANSGSDYTWYGDNAQSNVWKVNREINRDEQGDHPTPKPIKLIEIAIKNSTKPGDIVFDGFGGSGSTLIACEQLQRPCFMMELETKYCNAIIARWEKLTGRTATKIN